MFAIFSPIIGMIHNEKENRWHPVLFKESPLPGPPSDDKPIRHKSHGHHTEGFDNREAAVASAKELAEQVKENAIGPVSLALEKDFPWDGEDVPAMVAFFQVKDGVATPMF